MSDRGRVQVSSNNVLMRWYNTWRRLKGWDKTERKHIDLCHFMRVLLFWAPLRWSFQKELLFTLPLVVLAPALVLGSFMGYETVTHLSQVWFVTKFVLLAMVALGVVVGIGIGLAKLLIHNPEKWDAVAVKVGNALIKVTKPIWWTVAKVSVAIWKVLRAVGLASWHYAIKPFGDWFFTKRVFTFGLFGELISCIPAVIFVALIFLSTQVALLIHHTWGTLIIYGIIVASLSLAASIVFGAVKVRAYSLAHPPEPSVKLLKARKAKPKKEHETAKILWAWIVAKKHRACPLIEVKG